MKSKRGRPPVPDDVRRAITLDRLSGMRIRDIAAKHGVSAACVHNLSKPSTMKVPTIPGWYWRTPGVLVKVYESYRVTSGTAGYDDHGTESVLRFIGTTLTGIVGGSDCDSTRYHGPLLPRDCPEEILKELFPAKQAVVTS